MRKPLGVAVVPLETRREALVATALAADRLGYDAYLQNETWAFDATLLLAELAVRTERLRLATGVLGVWSRTAGTLAMAASTLAAMSNGRFALGLGASTPQLTEGLHDVPYGAPLARMRQTVEQVRALLRGDRIPLGLATAARPLRLNTAPRPDVPIYLAGLADATLRLAGELADGWLPFLYPRDRLADGRALLQEGAARTGDPDRAVGIHPTIPTVVDEDPVRARAGVAWFVAFYLTSMGALYRTTLVRLGFGREVDAVLAANTPKMAGVVPPEAEPLLEQLTIWGSPVEACARLEGWYAAGADMPTVILPAGLAPKAMEFMLDAFRPLGREPV
jgi:alkanesulfonate monooxygenase SsuD/methylene tetrahydromethanopterin reductase-like flavin-dependent oxidoreductase (luciferase family)